MLYCQLHKFWLMFRLLYFCRERPHQELADWTDKKKKQEKHWQPATCLKINIQRVLAFFMLHAVLYSVYQKRKQSMHCYSRRKVLCDNRFEAKTLTRAWTGLMVVQYTLLHVQYVLMHPRDPQHWCLFALNMTAKLNLTTFWPSASMQERRSDTKQWRIQEFERKVPKQQTLMNFTDCTV